MKTFLQLILACLVSVSLWGTTITYYYVSKSTGADTNDGLTKGTAWVHMPGMPSCTDSCAAHTPVLDDAFVLMGCDTWVNSDLPVLWDWSGTSGHPITITVDPTWYNTTSCPSAWNRPIFDAQKTTIATRNILFTASWSGATSYVTLDNIEFKGFHCATSCTANNDAFLTSFNTTEHWTLSNLYFHGWDVGLDSCTIVRFLGGNGNTFTAGVIDGSDATGADPAAATCYAFYPDLMNITNSVIHDLANGIVGHADTADPVEIGGNLIYNIEESNAGSHPNAIELLNTVGDAAATYNVHDNVIHDSLGENLMTCSANQTFNVWNNVIYNILGSPPDIDTRNGECVGKWLNNTVVGNTTYCFLQTGTGATTQLIENNHCISSVGLTNGTTGYTLTTNLLQTPTVANENLTPEFDQYNASQTPYVYSPVAATNSTNAAVTPGTDLTGDCAGALTGLCSDTAYANLRTPVARPSGSAWSIGAFGAYGAPTGPVAGVSTASISFSNTMLGIASAVSTVTLSNTGDDALSISSIAMTGGNAGDFAQTNNCGARLAASGSCTITVTFTPTALAARSTSLRVSSNDPVNPTLDVTLGGTGTPLAAPTLMLTVM